jgi:hypothetical protein
MKTRVTLLLPAVAIILLLILAGCGGNSTPLVAAPRTETPASAAPGPIYVKISPSMAVTLSASQSQQFTATGVGLSNTAVTWSLVDCSTQDCGTLSADGLYTAPSFIPAAKEVWVKATSQADTKMTNSTPVRLVPISVAVTPSTPTNVPPGGTHDFAAVVQYDAQNAGVTWALSGAGCSGEFCGTLGNATSTSVVYHAPSTAPNPPAVTLTATSVTDVHKSMSVMFTVSATPALLLGKYAFLINGWRREGDVDTSEAIAGHFDADGTETITGVWDANRGAAVSQAQPITGSYSIQPDGRGTLEMRSGTSAWTFAIALDQTGTTAWLAESTIAGGASNRRGSSGYIAKQDADSFAASSTEGDRIIGLFGEASCCHLAAVGRFTSSAGGSISNAAMDLSWVVNDNTQKFPNSVALAGTFGTPDTATGRGVATLTFTPAGAPAATYAFAYYIVSAETMLLVQTDTAGHTSGLLVPTVSGEVRKQHGAGTFTNASLSAPVVFHLSNSSPIFWCGPFPAATIGKMVPDGAGSVSTTFDQNEASDLLLNTAVTGTYSVAANGRVTLNAGMYANFFGEKKTVYAAVGYLVDQNHGYLIQQGGMSGSFGAFEPQTGEPFSAATLAGTYVVNTGPPTTVDAENDSGRLTLAADGTASATLYVNTGSGTLPYMLTGTFSVTSNGRGTMTLDTQPPTFARQFVFWASSPTRGVATQTYDYGNLFYIERVGD